MESSDALLVIGRDSRVYDALNEPRIGHDFRLYFCGKNEDLEAFLRENSVRIIILDTEEPASGDIDILVRLKRFDPLLDVIVVGPVARPEDMLEWVDRGASDVLVRPLDISAVAVALRKLVGKRDLRRETFKLEKQLEKKYVFQGMVSKNPYMFEIFATIENIARFVTSVLITGETGTGKEMVARAIHQLSAVRNRRLVVCDCASIPESLFESELFGYVRGAFTGADRTKKGLFEEAHEGAIFLDEVGEIPLAVQAKLLRVLENHQFRPLGSNETKHVDVRVIAATNRDIALATKRGAFREDLYHRLNRIEIRIPPLRERKEDVPLLIHHVLETIDRAYGKSVKGVSRDAQKRLLRYSWPGNIRELENVLQSAALATKKDFIDVPDLPKTLRDAKAAGLTRFAAGTEKLASLDEVEKDYIRHVLSAMKFNLKKAAGVLDISRTTLYNKMEKYGITREKNS